MTKKELFDNELLIETISSYNYPYYMGDDSNWYEDVLSECHTNDIKEGLIKTYPLDFVVGRLDKFGGIARPNNKRNAIYYSIDNKNSLSDIDKYIKYVNSLGYFISQYKVLYVDKKPLPLNYITYKNPGDIINLKDINELWLIIEPKFDQILGSDVEYLYHITEDKYLDKIKSKGVIPRSLSKKSYHPDRIYVVTNKRYINPLLRQFSDKSDSDFSTIKIDYKLAGKPKLYNDPNYLNYGYYITDNISPQSIISIFKNLFLNGFS